MDYSKVEVIAHDMGYRISDTGDILNKKNNIIKGFSYNVNYRRFGIRVNSKVLKVKVHRLVAYQKFGDMIYEDGIVVRHLDGNGSNNCIDNIEIGTYSDNSMDIPEEVRTQRALHASSYTNKLTNLEIIRLQSLYKDGYRMKFLMKEFNIKSKGSYSNYINKKTFR